MLFAFAARFFQGIQNKQLEQSIQDQKKNWTGLMKEQIYDVY